MSCLLFLQWTCSLSHSPPPTLLHLSPQPSSALLLRPEISSADLLRISLFICSDYYFGLSALTVEICPILYTSSHTPLYSILPRVSTVVTIHLLSNYSALCIHLSITSSCFLLMCQQCRCAVNVKCSIFTVISVGGQILLAALSRGVCNNLSF